MQVDLSLMFPEVKEAIGILNGSRIDVYLVQATIGDRSIGTVIQIDVDKIATSLEKIRRAQAVERAPR